MYNNRAFVIWQICFLCANDGISCFWFVLATRITAALFCFSAPQMDTFDGQEDTLPIEKGITFMAFLVPHEA